MSSTTKPKLYRSRTDHVLAGVCGGLGQYLSIDPTLVRVFFVLLALAQGIGVVAYVLLWIVLPYEGQRDRIRADSLRSGAAEIAERARRLAIELRAAMHSSNPQ